MSADLIVLRNTPFPQNDTMPASCSRCGAGRRPSATEEDGHEPIIYMGMDFEFEGAVYWCESCFRELEKVVNDTIPNDKGLQVAQLQVARRRDGQLMRGLRDENNALLLRQSAQAEQLDAMRDEINALRKK